jgi:hypothetical protein
MDGRAAAVLLCRERGPRREAAGLWPFSAEAIITRPVASAAPLPINNRGKELGPTPAPFPVGWPIARTRLRGPSAAAPAKLAPSSGRLTSRSLAFSKIIQFPSSGREFKLNATGPSPPPNPRLALKTAPGPATPPRCPFKRLYRYSTRQLLSPQPLNPSAIIPRSSNKILLHSCFDDCPPRPSCLRIIENHEFSH